MKQISPLRKPVAYLCLAALCFVLSSFLVGELLSYPAHRTVGAPPPELPAKSVRFSTPQGQAIAGWMATGRPGAGAVLLLHGVRGDRRQMLGHAKFLHRLGYAVLLIDLPTHGESDGERITFGPREADGVTAALAYLSQQFPFEKIGVIANSLGAASLVLSQPQPQSLPIPSAVVLEGMFPTIEAAVSNRIDFFTGVWGPLGPLLTPFLLWQLPLRLGISAEQIRPISKLASLSSPVLIIGGAADKYTPSSESRSIYAAANEPKELWLIEGAGHVNFHAFATAVYEEKVAAFLEKNLGSLGGKRSDGPSAATPPAPPR